MKLAGAGEDSLLPGAEGQLDKLTRPKIRLTELLANTDMDALARAEASESELHLKLL